MMPAAFPDGAVYDSTNCIESLGVKHTDASHAEAFDYRRGERHRLVLPGLATFGVVMRRMFGWSYSFNPAARVTRLAIAAGALSGLAMLGACADAGKTIAGPSSPRNATIDSGGLGFAKIVQLCVDARRPAGT